jgi:hypothetical protein
MSNLNGSNKGARMALTSASDEGAPQIIYPFCDDCWKHAFAKFGKYEEYRVFYYCKEHLLRKVLQEVKA